MRRTGCGRRGHRQIVHPAVAALLLAGDLVADPLDKVHLVEALAQVGHDVEGSDSGERGPVEDGHHAGGAVADDNHAVQDGRGGRRGDGGRQERGDQAGDGGRQM